MAQDWALRIWVAAPGRRRQASPRQSPRTGGGPPPWGNGSGLDFTEFDVNRMKLGRRYRVSCQIWERDRGRSARFDRDDFCFAFRKVWPFDKSNVAAPGTKAVGFQETHDEDVLDHDGATEDDIYGLLVLQTSTGGAWTTVASRETNRIDHRF